MFTLAIQRAARPARCSQFQRFYVQASTKPQEGLKSNQGQARPSTHDHAQHHHHGILGHSHSHGHDHSHSLTAELLTSDSPRQNPAVRITLIGFVTNVGMAIGKGIGGVVFHSQSLIADSIHAMSDLVSDIMTLCTVSVARKPPTRYFPNGFGRIEAVGAFGVSSMLVLAGVSMGWGSLGQIASSFGINWIHFGHSHHHAAELADWSAAGIAFLSIGIKEALYQATKRVAERENSPVLLANAWHHRVDCLVSAVAVTSITAGQLLQATWVDPLGGLIVSGLIIRAGWPPLANAAMELCGSAKQAMQSETFGEFETNAREALSKIAPHYQVADCMLESYGSTFVGSVKLHHVDQNAEDVAERLRQELLQIKHMRQVYIRI